MEGILEGRNISIHKKKCPANAGLDKTILKSDLRLQLFCL